MQVAEVSGPDRISAFGPRAFFSARLWRGCAHLATDAVMGLLGIGVLLVVLAAVVLVPFGVGLFLLAPAARLLFRVADAERTRYAATCGLFLPSPRLPRLDQGTPRAVTTLVGSGAFWRQAAYFLLLIPVATATSVVVVIAWSVPLTVAALPLYYKTLPSGRANVLGVTVASKGHAILVCVVAVIVLLVVSPWLVRLLRGLDIALARTLLGPPRRQPMSERVEELTESRARVVDAAEAERRRIERDLHDGAQQRLVAMSMTLGRLSARLRASGDADNLALVEEARQDARQAISEIRDLTRGLHPPVLTDRGLDAALSAIAARLPIPVSVDVRAEPRPPITVEAIAYFVVTEALTNVTKHAQATRAEVVIRRQGDRLCVRVTDDGRGGADPAGGSGLTGLADRVSGVDGVLRLSSPPGGPTVIEVELACGS
ncbi:sensor histidine kinase [Fodinicola acaciae]|uniref:sensor histidine kinase n=1 Tax=Fodinicola acaciae TaxID=2681555 RepID=UPI0013D1CA8E|nr:sensor histidine kinase [Fodinicola acaciae]